MGGGFGLAWVTLLAQQHRHAWAAYPVALLAVLWIAPFYGFFVAPLFLGLTLNTVCPDRSLAGVILVAVGMRVGEKVGLLVVRWTSGASPTGQI